MGSDVKVEPVETARAPVPVTGWFAVGDSKETEVIDGIASVDGERLHIDAKGWLHIHVVKRGLEG